MKMKFAAALMLGLALFVPAYGQKGDADDGGPKPNQECGNASTHESAEICKKSECVASLSDALGDASDAVAGALGANSGVVCSICPDGLQCARSVIMDSAGQSFSFSSCTLPSGKPGFKAKLCFKGKYAVICADC